MHIALLGDSVFDNAAYTRGEPDVVSHIRDLMPASWKATLCAVDGAITSGVERQIREVPAAATHVVLSVGGNDALGHIDLLDSPVASTAEALDLFSARISRFEPAYTRALEAVVALRRHTTACTIYNGNLGGKQAGRARVALATFNDAILRTALRLRVDAIDLRLVCDQPEDFANPIEPSGTGGRKIAMAILRALGGAEEPARRTVVTAG